MVKPPSVRAQPPRLPGGQHGFTMVVVLLAMTLLALSLQTVMTVLATDAQREKELRLLQAGQAIREAIASYHERSPGALKAWPTDLRDLLDDRRMVVMTRHLRRIDPDPFTEDGQWGLIREVGGGITGVHSRSQAQPLIVSAVELDAYGVRPGERHAQWRFEYRPGADGGGR